VICHGFPPHQISGGEIHTWRKVHWWHNHGHEVRVIAANPGPVAGQPFETVFETEDSVDGVPVLRLQFAVADASRSVQETFEHPALGEILEREVVKFAPDVIYQVSGYLFGVLPLRIARAHGIPAIVFAIDYWYVCPRVTLLRPDGSVCPGPRSPADCAACRLTARSPALALGPTLNRVIWHAAATAGRLPLPGTSDTRAYAQRQAAIRDVLDYAALVVVNSRFLAGKLQSLGVDKQKIRYITPGIDSSEFTNLPVDTSPPGDELRLLYLGQVTQHKGVDLLIEAAGRLRAEGLPVSLDVFGPQTDGDRFLRRVDGYVDDTTIRLHPAASRESIIAMLPGYHALVVPGRWYDNSPNVIREAFACGVPVVTANHGGTAEMVRDGIDGLLFEPGDVHSLSVALRRLATEPGLPARLRAGIERPPDIDIEMRTEEAEIVRVLTRLTQTAENIPSVSSHP